MKLTNDNIARAVEEIQDFFEQADVSERDRLKINLTVEEALLRYQKYFGAEKDFQIKTHKLFGAPSVLIRIRGKAYNPLDTSEDYDDEVITAKVMQNLLQYETAGTSYRYQNGFNEISIFSTRERKSIKIPGGNITVAILLAFAAAFIVKQMPQFVQDFHRPRLNRTAFVESHGADCRRHNPNDFYFRRVKYLHDGRHCHAKRPRL